MTARAFGACTDRPTFELSRWLPVILQTEASECGLVCLVEVLNHSCVVTNLNALAARHAVSLAGMAHKEAQKTRGLNGILPTTRTARVRGSRGCTPAENHTGLYGATGGPLE